MGMDEKRRAVGAVCLKEQCEKKELSFEEILLDETLAQGEIWVLSEALRNVGGMNYRLSAKRNYELLIRIAKEYVILQLEREVACGSGGEEGEKYLLEEERKENWLRLEPEGEMTFNNGGMWEQEALKTDCYLIGRYKTELLSMGCFDDAVLGIISTGREDLTRYLEQMLAQTEAYYEIYDCTQPILIYRGSAVCYNILDTFAVCLGSALKELGQNVEYFDIGKQAITELDDLARRRFKAVIGIQAYMFSVKREKGSFVHDEIIAPKYQFWFDHPIRGREHLQQVSRGLCVLTPDGNYAEFVRNFYGNPARFLPPAGYEMSYEREKQRDYGIVFLGSYYDGPIKDLQIVRSIDRKRAYLLNRYILLMRRNLKMTPEEALKETLEYYGIVCTKEEFIEIMYKERWVIYCLSYHYRNKVIRLLLEEGITLHVFGDTWKKSPMRGHTCLIHHEAVTGEEALEVYARSKMSLNIMTWHKDGFTERIANAMLQRSLVVTDRTVYLEKNFTDGEDLLLFDLNHPEELARRIKELLCNEEKRKQMAKKGYRKALQEHTWLQRAEKILEFMEEDRKQF